MPSLLLSKLLCFDLCLLRFALLEEHLTGNTGCCWLSFSRPLKRTIFSFYDNFTVQWQGYFKVWINQQAIENESRKYCSVEAIWYHFLKYKNTSSRDFQGPTKQCLAETTHPNRTKCLSYSMLFDRVLVGLWVPLQLQYINLVGFIARTFLKSGVENIPW